MVNYKRKHYSLNSSDYQIKILYLLENIHGCFVKQAHWNEAEGQEDQNDSKDGITGTECAGHVIGRTYVKNCKYFESRSLDGLDNSYEQFVVSDTKIKI